MENNAIDVLFIGSLTSAEMELIQNAAGGSTVNIRHAYNPEGAVALHTGGNETFELIMFKLDRYDGRKALKKLKNEVRVKSMIVGVGKHRLSWRKVGANMTLPKPLTEENMLRVFDHLKVGIMDGTYRKMLRVVIVEDHYNLEYYLKDIFTSMGALLRGIAEPATLVQNSCDIILVTRASMINDLLAMGFDYSVMVGVALSIDGEYHLLGRALGGRVLLPPFTGDTIALVIPQLAT